MQTIPCPGCRTELGPEITACPICTRPRTKYEISRAYAALRAAQEKRRKRPFIIAKFLLAAGAAAALVHYFRVPVRDGLAAGIARVGRFVDDARDPGRLAARGTQPPPPVPQAPAPAAPPPPVPFAAEYSRPTPPPMPIRAAPPQPAPAPPAVVRPKPEGDLPVPELESTEWVLRGTVFNLVTLRPIARAMFSVRHNDHLEASFVTDEDGRYLVVLTRVTDAGYELFNTTPDFAPRAYSESDIPYAQLTTAERRDMAETARAGDVHPTPIPDISGEAALHRDLFIVRRR